MFVVTCFRYVYLAEAGGERVNVYARKSNNRLRLLQVKQGLLRRVVSHLVEMLGRNLR